jgi:hypothetical protein
MKQDRQALWTQRIQDQRASKLSQKQWCQENGVNFHTFSYWNRKSNKHDMPKRDALPTAWVTLENPTDTLHKSAFRIRIGEAVIEIDHPTEAIVRSLIETLMHHGS